MLIRDIYFKCPCCRKQLVVERAAAGFEAPCPGCSASILIPKRSGIPPRILRIVGMIALNAGIAGVALLVYGIIPTIKRADDTAAQTAARSAKLVSSGKPATSKAIPSEANGPRMDELLSQNLALAERNNQLATQFDAMASWVVDTYQGKYPLPLDMVAKLRLNPLNEDFSLSGEVTQFLKVTPKEATLANDAFAYTREQMHKTEASLVSVTQTADNSVTLYVPPYQKEGTALREDLYGALEAALGAPRFDKLVDVTQQDLAKAYHYFGSAARTMQFEVVPQQGNDTAYLLIRDSWQIPDGESVTRYDAKETAVREIPPEYAGYLNWLPAGVAAFPVQQKNGT